jgi:hypothetical protein
MAETTEAPETTLTGYFDSRERAEAACARLRTADGRYDPRLGVTENGYAVTVEAPQPGQLATARVALKDAGAEAIEEGAAEAGRAPRPVQPGFTDAAPGIVPEATDFPAEKYEGSGGRFAEQLDQAPETPPADER